jgi:hypothetical protein
LGAIHELPLSVLALEMKRSAGLTAFVETGTFLGNSIEWASANFDQVWTIEINPNYLASARERHQSLSNVHYMLGDSTTELTKALKQLTGPALCWLDAHAGAGFFGPEDNCPLMAELEAVLSSPYEHCILIDDARAFVAPPPPPFDHYRWPPLETIFGAIAVRPDYHVVIISDALIAVPGRFRDLVAQFCFSIRPEI